MKCKYFLWSMIIVSMMFFLSNCQSVNHDPVQEKFNREQRAELLKNLIQKTTNYCLSQGVEPRTLEMNKCYDERILIVAKQIMEQNFKSKGKNAKCKAYWRGEGIRFFCLTS